MFLDLKVAELSVIILWGHPNLERILPSMNWVIIEILACLVGIASIHLVR